MFNARVAAIVVGVMLVALWVSAAAGACAVRRTPASGSSAASAEGTSPALGAASALRQTGRLAPGASPGLPAARRNLFRFRDESPTPPAPTPPSPAALFAAPASAPDPGGDAPPAASLLGIAERRQGDVTVRTAVIAAAGDLWLVADGGVVAGRYTVVRIAAESVELRDTASGATQRLRLPK
jgi:hypothetical protein